MVPVTFNVPTFAALAWTLPPHRIQRRRTKGWRLPEGAVIVDRTTGFGNPFPIDAEHPPHVVVEIFRWLLDDLACLTYGPPPAVQYARRRWIREHIGELRGKDLACPCPLGQPCHADVLLELANAA